MSNRYVWVRSNIIYEANDGELRSYEQFRTFDVNDNVSGGSTLYVDVWRELVLDAQGTVTNEPYDTLQYPSIFDLEISVPRNVYFSAYFKYNEEVVFRASPTYMKSPRTTSSTVSGLGGDWGSGTDEHFLSITVEDFMPVTIEPAKGTANGTATNAASSTYPPCDAAGRITSICAVLPIIRRCRDVQ